MQKTRTREETAERTSAELERTDEVELEDLFRQVPKVLQGRRWQAQDGPFQGFGSPPGRF